MTEAGLTNLARIGKLAAEPGSVAEIVGLLRSGVERLRDARNEALAYSSRFDLAYNAAHAFSLAALRWHGYRSDNRYLVFQALPHTPGLPAPVWRVLAKAHEVRNAAEYEGCLDVDLALPNGLIDAAEKVSVAVGLLPAPGAKSP
ncbi:MAG: hypothetical protein HZB40_20965 [Rhodocyclales bacterium]|nr:hypothetical protein [Rhodocyclales bacterium]